MLFHMKIQRQNNKIKINVIQGLDGKSNKNKKKKIFLPSRVFFPPKAEPSLPCFILEQKKSKMHILLSHGQIINLIYANSSSMLFL